MLRLSFNNFWDRLNLNKQGGIGPILHYLEDDKGFTFIFKAHDEWEYYMSVSYDEINNFAELQETSYEEVKRDFKINYCSNAVELKAEDVPEEVLIPVLTKDFLEAGEDIVDSSVDYGDFMEKVVDKMEKKVINALKYIDLNVKQKTFGQFLQVLMNSVNSKAFMSQVRKMIKKSMVQGLEDSEKEMSIDIGWTKSFDDKLTALEGEQLNGYTINGKKWYGIKGATQELQVKILQSISEDVKNKVSKEVIADNIKELFQGATTSQVKRIARTETTRFINESKITSYKEAKIPGKKAWSSVPKKCCDVCDRLQNKYFEEGIDFEAQFIDDVTGKAWQAPPSHPNCRCVVEYRTVNEA